MLPESTIKWSSYTLSVRRKLILLSSAQCRAARGLLSWSQACLAERAGVNVSTVKDFELSRRVVSSRKVSQLCAAIAAAGVSLIPEDRRGGVGVRFTSI